MYGHEPLIRHLQSWCRDNLPQGSPGRHALHEAWGRYFDAKLAEMEAPHDNAGLFGMSSAAGCLRANALRRAGVPGEPATGDDLVTWEIGHALESFALAVLEASGFTLSGTQVPAVVPGLMRSAADGVLAAGPVDLPYPLLVSVKSRAYKQGFKGQRRGFAALGFDGIFAAEGTAYAQSQLEMIALDYRHTLVLVIAKDVIKAYEGDQYMPSLSWYAELLPANPGSVRRILDAHKLAVELADPAIGANFTPPRDVPPITFWPNGNGFKGIRLPDPGNVKDKWGGENQSATGRYNPCFSCSYAALCRGEVR